MSDFVAAKYILDNMKNGIAPDNVEAINVMAMDGGAKIRVRPPKDTVIDNRAVIFHHVRTVPAQDPAVFFAPCSFCPAARIVSHNAHGFKACVHFNVVDLCFRVAVCQIVVISKKRVCLRYNLCYVRSVPVV